MQQGQGDQKRKRRTERRQCAFCRTVEDGDHLLANDAGRRGHFVVRKQEEVVIEVLEAEKVASVNEGVDYVAEERMGNDTSAVLKRQWPSLSH